MIEKIVETINSGKDIYNVVTLIRKKLMEIQSEGKLPVNVEIFIVDEHEGD